MVVIIVQWNGEKKWKQKKIKLVEPRGSGEADDP